MCACVCVRKQADKGALVRCSALGMLAPPQGAQEHKTARTQFTNHPPTVAHAAYAPHLPQPHLKSWPHWLTQCASSMTTLSSRPPSCSCCSHRTLASLLATFSGVMNTTCGASRAGKGVGSGCTQPGGVQEGGQERIELVAGVSSSRSSACRAWRTCMCTCMHAQPNWGL